MEKQELNLANLFQQLGNQSEKIELPDFKLKDAVFSTIDATSLVADIVDLFTIKFVQAQSEIVDAIPDSEFGFDEKERVFSFLEKKYKESKQNTEGVADTDLDATDKEKLFKFLERKYREGNQSTDNQ
ncbi:MAG: hypothetical protein JNL70_12280 [Saprospiraceae bacterium]|nr:hypothetical protein [Saprospiraceae bacterium]